MRFEIKEGINKSKEVELFLREEVDQLVFVINFDKHKISLKRIDPLVREKWHQIMSFLKSRISLVDPDRLRSITVMMPPNSRKGVRTKKVKLLIILFLLLVSENYILVQKTNGFAAVEKDGNYMDVYNIKAALSKYYKRSRPSKRSIYSLLKTSQYEYAFEALKNLTSYRVIDFPHRTDIPHNFYAEKIPSSPYFIGSGSNQSPGEFSPLRNHKKKQTRIEMNQLIKIFDIEDEPDYSDPDEIVELKEPSMEMIESSHNSKYKQLELEDPKFVSNQVPCQTLMKDIQKRSKEVESLKQFPPIQEIGQRNTPLTLKQMPPAPVSVTELLAPEPFSKKQRPPEHPYITRSHSNRRLTRGLVTLVLSVQERVV